MASLHAIDTRLRTRSFVWSGGWRLGSGSGAATLCVLVRRGRRLERTSRGSRESIGAPTNGSHAFGRSSQTVHVLGRGQVRRAMLTSVRINGLGWNGMVPNVTNGRREPPGPQLASVTSTPAFGHRTSTPEHGALERQLADAWQDRRRFEGAFARPKSLDQRRFEQHLDRRRGDTSFGGPTR